MVFHEIFGPRVGHFQCDVRCHLDYKFKYDLFGIQLEFLKLNELGHRDDDLKLLFQKNLLTNNFSMNFFYISMRLI